MCGMLCCYAGARTGVFASEEDDSEGSWTTPMCDIPCRCAGVRTGVFASEEDDFDDALASLDVEELVAASQRGSQSQRGTESRHSPPSGRSGATPSPTLCKDAMHANL